MPLGMEWLLAVYVLIFGAIVGSFLNVIIHRLPLEESIVFPASRCPSCRTPIRFYDNIPVVSWVVLRGRCRSCREPISPRYPLVELANGIFYAALYLHTGVDWAFIPLAATISIFIALVFIDLDVQLLPDVLDLPGIAIGVAIGALRAGDRLPLVVSSSWIDSLIGAAAGAGILYALSVAYRLIRKVEGMGLGDVKMLGMIGAVVGWQAVAPVLFVASIVGAVFGIALAMRREEGLQAALPFGIFLGLATLAVMFFGDTLFEWYRSLLVP